MILRYSAAVSLPRSLIGTANLVVVEENGLAVERRTSRLARMTERAEDIAAMFVRLVGGEDALRCKKAKVGRYYFEEILTQQWQWYRWLTSANAAGHRAGIASIPSNHRGAECNTVPCGPKSHCKPAQQSIVDVSSLLCNSCCLRVYKEVGGTGPYLLRMYRGTGTCTLR